LHIYIKKWDAENFPGNSSAPSSLPLLVLSLSDRVFLFWGKNPSVLGEVQYQLLKRENNVGTYREFIEPFH
jgi:hypothetical protein